MDTRRRWAHGVVWGRGGREALPSEPRWDCLGATSKPLRHRFHVAPRAAALPPPPPAFMAPAAGKFQGWICLTPISSRGIAFCLCQQHRQPPQPPLPLPAAPPPNSTDTRGSPCTCSPRSPPAGSLSVIAAVTPAPLAVTPRPLPTCGARRGVTPRKDPQRRWVRCHSPTPLSPAPLQSSPLLRRNVPLPTRRAAPRFGDPPTPFPFPLPRGPHSTNPPAPPLRRPRGRAVRTWRDGAESCGTLRGTRRPRSPWRDAVRAPAPARGSPACAAVPAPLRAVGIAARFVPRVYGRAAL